VLRQRHAGVDVCHQPRVFRHEVVPVGHMEAPGGGLHDEEGARVLRISAGRARQQKASRTQRKKSHYGATTRTVYAVAPPTPFEPGHYPRVTPHTPAHLCTFSTPVSFGVKGMGSRGIVMRIVRVTRTSSAPPPLATAAGPVPLSASGRVSVHGVVVMSRHRFIWCRFATENPAESLRQFSWNSEQKKVQWVAKQ
jgi:hypothetical protein